MFWVLFYNAHRPLRTNDIDLPPPHSHSHSLPIVLLIRYMSNSQNWVSHTPETKPQDYKNSNQTLTPPSSYEKFFLPIEDQRQFAQAASRLLTTHRPKSSISLTSESLRTEDFATAAEDLSEASDLDDISIEKALYSNDILGLSHSILEETQEDEEMGSKKNRTSAAAASTATATVLTTPEPSTTETAHFDVVDHVYEGVKSAWATGKNIAIFKPFMGVAEGVATKLLSVATGVDSLNAADQNIKPHVHGIDTAFIDPAIVKLWSLLEPILGKGDEVIKGVIGFVHRPAIKDGAKVEPLTKVSSEVVDPETSTPPAVTA